MLRHFLFAGLVSTAAGFAYADGSAACGKLFLNSTPPSLVTAQGRTQQLCLSSYAVLSNTTLRAPHWSAERLTGDAVMSARQLARDSDFYEEPRLPPSGRAALADFARSGYDRGHLAPSGDFADKAGQADSFSLANVVPQDPASNRRLWSHIETSTRRLARQHGVVHVVTGAVYGPAPLRLRDRVAVPRYLWKAIAIPNAGAAAYIARNDGKLLYSVISIEELARFAGVDPLPALSRSARQNAIDLPPPTPHPGEKTGRLAPLGALTKAESSGEAEATRFQDSPAARFVMAVATLHF